MRKILSLILVLASFCLVACRPQPHICWNKRPENFVTNYTEQEHIGRISEITEYYYSRHNDFKYNTLKDYNVYIVYSYDERPENFYITFEWEKPIEYEGEDDVELQTYYTHFVGYIENDCYYRLEDYSNAYRIGKGFWAEYNVLDKKKYCTLFDYYGYEDENGKLIVYTQRNGDEEDVYLEYSIKEGITKEELVEKANSEVYMCKYPYKVDMRSRPETFTTKYCEEEHVLRIKDAVGQYYSDNGTRRLLKEINAYIVYSYDERPEFFYVITKWYERWEEDFVYEHLIGYIENDEYYLIGDYEKGAKQGKGFWADQDALDKKKYCTLHDYLGYLDEEGNLVVYTEKENTESSYYMEYEKAEGVTLDFLISKTQAEKRVWFTKLG